MHHEEVPSHALTNRPVYRAATRLTVAIGDGDKMCAVIADEEPSWEPGTKIGYHAVTWGFVVGEIVRRATGKPISDVLREEVAGPREWRTSCSSPFRSPSRIGWRFWMSPSPMGWPRDGRDAADSPMFKVGPAECTTAACGNRADVRSSTIVHAGVHASTITGSARTYAAPPATLETSVWADERAA